jgi:SAM-dependent methyltransferase
MSDLAPHHERVGHAYGTSGHATSGYDYELERLDRHSPVEYAITARYLRRFIAEELVVADIGVGVGHYSELLARRGCAIHLVDVSQRLLDATVARLRDAGLADRIAGIHHASATDLSCLPDDCCDAALLLGPLYHIGAQEERRHAVDECARILREGGTLFAAGINRLASLRDQLRTAPDSAVEHVERHRRLLQDGNLEVVDAGYPITVHLTSAAEFGAEFAHTFTQMVLAGTESFAESVQDAFLRASPENAEAWLDLVEQTGLTAEGQGASDHYLYIGRR